MNEFDDLTVGAPEAPTLFEEEPSTPVGTPKVPPWEVPLVPAGQAVEAPVAVEPLTPSPFDDLVVDGPDEPIPGVSPELTLGLAQKFDASLVSRARKLGISAEEAMMNPERVAMAEKKREEAWETLRQDFPETAAMFGDLDRAAALHDDVSTLTKIEGQFRDWWSNTDKDTHFFSSVAGGVVDGVGKAVTGLGNSLYALETQLMSNMRNTFGAHRVDNFRARIDQLSTPVSKLMANVLGVGDGPVLSDDPDAFISPTTEEFFDKIGSYVSDWAGENLTVPDENSHPLDRLGFGLGGLGNQVALRSSPVALAAYLAAQGAQQQAQLIDSTVDQSGEQVYARDRATAILAAMPITAITEWAVLEKLLADATAKGVKGALKSVAGGGAYEVLQEQGEKALHGQLAETVTGVEQEKLMSVGEVLDVFLVGSVAKGTNLAVRASTKRALLDQLAEGTVEQGQSENQQVNRLLDSVQASVTPGRDSEAFAEFVSNSVPEDAQIVITREAVEQAIDNSEDESNSAAIELLRERIAEDPEGDVVVLTGEEAATTLFTADIANDLREHYTMNVGTLPPAREAEAREMAASFVDRLVDETMDRARDEAEGREVFKNALESLKEVGNLSARDRKIMAEIVPRWAASKAKREGLTPLQVLEGSGLLVRRGDGFSIDQDGTRSVVRGWYELGQGAISLTNAESRLTFMHEMAHFMLDMENTQGPIWQGTREWMARNGLADFAQEVADLTGQDNGTVNQRVSPAVSALANVRDDSWGESFTDIKEWRKRYGDRPDKLTPEDHQLVNEVDVVSDEAFERIAAQVEEESGDRVANRHGLNWMQLYGEVSTFVGPRAAAQIFSENGAVGMSRTVDGTNLLTVWGEDYIDSAEADRQYQEVQDIGLFREGQRTGKFPEGITETMLLNFLETGTSGATQLDPLLTRALHEKFARGFEKYLMEGQAPTADMAKAFRDISRWASDLYAQEGGTDSLNVQMDDPMRALYDSLLTTPEQVAREAERANVEELFTDAAQAGMTQEEYDNYLKGQEERREKAEKTVREKIVGHIKTRMGREYRKRVNEAKEELREEVAEEQVHLARAALGKDLKLDYVAASEIVGTDSVNRDGEPIKVMPARMRGLTKKGGEGVDPQVAAELLGYNTAEEMLRDVVESPTFNQDLEARAQAKAEQDMGGRATEEEINRMVEEAVQSEVTEQELLEQLRVLNRTPTQDDQKAIRQKAEEMIGGMPLGRIKPGTYRAAYMKAAKAAAAAMREGDRELAAKHKRQQYMYLQAEIYAKKALGDAKAHRDWAKRHGTAKSIEAMARRGGGYAEQFQTVLRQFKLTNRNRIPLTDDKGLSVADFAENVLFNHGLHINVSQDTRLGTEFADARDITPDQLLGAVETLKSLERASKMHSLVVKAAKETELNEIVAELEQALEGRDPRNPIVSDDKDLSEAGYWRKFKKKMADFVAQNTKIPWMMRWMDGGKAAGAWYQAFVQPLSDAYSREQKLLRVISQPLVVALRERSEADIQRHRRKHTVSLPDGTTLTLSGHQIVHMAAHLGNVEGRRKVQQGYGMVAEGADPNVISPVAQQLLGNMTESDWGLVQTVWSQLELLYPQIADLGERITGKRPPKVEAVQIETPFGVMEGGYVPLKRRRSVIEKANDADADLNDLFQESDFFNNVGVDTSSRLERTEAVYEVELGLSGLSAHIREATHFITHYDAVRSVNTLIRDPRVERMVREHLSDSDFEQLLPWLVSVARDGRDSGPRGVVDDLLDHFRHGTTMVVMGFKASTAIMQTLGLFNSAHEVGIWNLAKGMTYMVRSPDVAMSTVKFVMERSRIMATRMASMDREMANALDRVASSRLGRAVDRYKDAAFAPIAYVQMYAVDMPTWMGAYHKEMAASGNAEKAAQYADFVVENVQGSGRNQTAAAIMRSKNSWTQAITMYMTFFSSLFNQSRDLAQKFKNKDLGVIEATSATLFMFVLPVFSEMLLRGEWPEDEEEYKDVAAALLSYPATTLPYVRDIAGSAQILSYMTGEGGGFGRVQPSPVLNTLGDVSTALATVPKLFDEYQEVSQRDYEAVARSVGAILKIPGVGQGVATSRHLVAWLEEGDQFSPRQLMMGQDRQK